MPCHISRDVFYPEVVHAHIWNFALSLVLYFTAKYFLWFRQEARKMTDFLEKVFYHQSDHQFYQMSQPQLSCKGLTVTCHGV